MKAEQKLGERTVEDIAKKDSCFFIKDYQRGYRWTKIEIEDLLNDILYVENEKYCLHPLIVKELTLTRELVDGDFCRFSENFEQYRELVNGKLCEVSTASCRNLYELIDGQQRLTTIKLILDELQEETHRIVYEHNRPVDEDFLKEAQNIIKKWFEARDDKVKGEFKVKLKRAYFIWYEMSFDENASENNTEAEEEFRNVNAGKIPLTNAELFKAMLINDEILDANGTSDKNIDLNRRDIYRIAFEWNELERELSDPIFWNFISNRECDDRARLDYLFELAAELIQTDVVDQKMNKRNKQYKEFKKYKEYIGGLTSDSDRYSFLVVNKYLEYKADEANGFKQDKKAEIRFADVRTVWEQFVKSSYYTLLKWFKDDELYNYVGYLVACNERKTSHGIVPDCIKTLFKEVGGKSLDEVKSRVRETLYDSLKNYVDNQSKQYFEKENFYTGNSKKYVRDFLLFFNVWMTHEAGERFPFYKFKKRCANGKTEWDIEHISARHSEDETEEEDNSISNLALLDSNTNRSYGNASFSEKREEIIKRDKKGWYIPIATKNVFLKYYSDNPGSESGWSQADKDDYLNEIKKCADVINNRFLPEGKNDCKEGHDEQ